jgi:hypothetical protein
MHLTVLQNSKYDASYLLVHVVYQNLLDIDHQIESLQKEVAALFDCPELQTSKFVSVLLHCATSTDKTFVSTI